jgi:hypothetical protein
MVLSLETEQAQRVAEYCLWYEHPTSNAFRMALSTTLHAKRQVKRARCARSLSIIMYLHLQD